MARDTALFESAEADPTAPPVFRLYTWSPPAISFGYHQVIEDEIDVDAAQARGFDIVRRPTGGRAILHHQELTYAVVAPLDDPRFGGRLHESHARISEVFRRALNSLGVPAVMAAAAGATIDDSPVEPGDSGVSAPCFAAATRTELVVNGRKILGSAQRRGSRAFLQHGSLLLAEGHLALVDCLKLPEAARERWRRRLAATTTTLGQELKRVPELEELVRAVGNSFRNEFGS
ncbi:MAG: lipoate-protein ligase A [bacterium]|nr:MAG: lipoate-protein ligase A [bacterium]